MYRVDIFTATKTNSNRKDMGKYGYVCTCITKSGKVAIIEKSGQIRGTKHETEVTAITEALSRLRQSCEVIIHCEDTFVANMIDHRIREWARNDFKNAKGQALANAAGWRTLWKKMQGNLIRTERGQHSYSEKIRKMMEGTENV